MTLSNAQGSEDFGADYPVVFGITMTPATQGIAIAIAGIGAAVYLAVNFVMPKYESYNELKAQVSEKEAQLERVAEERKQLEEVFKNLEEAQVLQNQVLALFPSEETTTTLPLDLNRIVTEQFGRLVKFEPDEAGAVVVSNGAWGAAVNGKLREETVSVTFEGDFDQTSNILRNLERYQALLVVDNIDSELTIANQPVRFDAKNGQLVAAGKPKIRIATSLELKVLTPVSSSELVEQQQAAEAAAEGEDKAE
ncbi:MAG: hypothetical protein AAF889_11705 [Cyanobacteria bacterium P01_D01_bin.73]